MTLKPQLRNILEIIADLSRDDVNTNVFDTSVIENSNLPTTEVHSYLSELESLGFIKMLQRISDPEDSKGQNYRLLNITREGLRELSDWEL
jgi:predicted transcriptional regulator